MRIINFAATEILDPPVYYVLQGTSQCNEVDFVRTYTSRIDRFPVTGNTLSQFRVSAPNQVWARDIAYVWTSEGWLYLAILLDRYSRP